MKGTHTLRGTVDSQRLRHVWSRGSPGSDKTRLAAAEGGTPGSNKGGVQVNTTLALVLHYTSNTERCDKEVEATLTGGRDLRGGAQIALRHAAADTTTPVKNKR